MLYEEHVMLINAQKFIVFIIISFFFKLIKTYLWIVVFCCVLHSHRDRIWVLTQDTNVEIQIKLIKLLFSADIVLI